MSKVGRLPPMKFLCGLCLLALAGALLAQQSAIEPLQQALELPESSTVQGPLIRVVDLLQQAEAAASAGDGVTAALARRAAHETLTDTLEGLSELLQNAARHGPADTAVSASLRQSETGPGGGGNPLLQLLAVSAAALGDSVYQPPPLGPEVAAYDLEGDGIDRSEAVRAVADFLIHGQATRQVADGAVEGHQDRVSGAAATGDRVPSIQVTPGRRMGGLQLVEMGNRAGRLSRWMTVRNTGTAALVLERIALARATRFSLSQPQIASGALVALDAQTIIEPGRSKIFAVVYDPSSDARIDADLLTLESNDPSFPLLSVSLVGAAWLPVLRVTPGNVGSPNVLDFGEVLVDTTETRSIALDYRPRISQSGAEPAIEALVRFIVRDGFALADGNLRLSERLIELDPEGAFEVPVAFEPKLGGSHQGRLLVWIREAGVQDPYNAPIAEVVLEGEGLRAPSTLDARIVEETIAGEDFSVLQVQIEPPHEATLTLEETRSGPALPSPISSTTTVTTDEDGLYRRVLGGLEGDERAFVDGIAAGGELSHAIVASWPGDTDHEGATSETSYTEVGRTHPTPNIGGSVQVIESFLMGETDPSKAAYKHDSLQSLYAALLDIGFVGGPQGAPAYNIRRLKLRLLKTPCLDCQWIKYLATAPAPRLQCAAPDICLTAEGQPAPEESDPEPGQSENTIATLVWEQDQTVSPLVTSIYPAIRAALYLQVDLSADSELWRLLDFSPQQIQVGGGTSGGNLLTGVPSAGIQPGSVIGRGPADVRIEVEIEELVGSVGGEPFYLTGAIEGVVRVPEPMPYLVVEPTAQQYQPLFAGWSLVDRPIERTLTLNLHNYGTAPLENVQLGLIPDDPTDAPAYQLELVSGQGVPFSIQPAGVEELRLRLRVTPDAAKLYRANLVIAGQGAGPHRTSLVPIAARAIDPVGLSVQHPEQVSSRTSLTLRPVVAWNGHLAAASSPAPIPPRVPARLRLEIDTQLDQRQVRQLLPSVRSQAITRFGPGTVVELIGQPGSPQTLIIEAELEAGQPRLLPELRLPVVEFQGAGGQTFEIRGELSATVTLGGATEVLTATHEPTTYTVTDPTFCEEGRWRVTGSAEGAGFIVSVEQWDLQFTCPPDAPQPNYHGTYLVVGAGVILSLYDGYRISGVITDAFTIEELDGIFSGVQAEVGVGANLVVVPLASAAGGYVRVDWWDHDSVMNAFTYSLSALGLTGNNVEQAKSFTAKQIEDLVRSALTSTSEEIEEIFSTLAPSAQLTPQGLSRKLEPDSRVTVDGLKIGVKVKVAGIVGWN